MQVMFAELLLLKGTIKVSHVRLFHYIFSVHFFSHTHIPDSIDIRNLSTTFCKRVCAHAPVPEKKLASCNLESSTTALCVCKDAFITIRTSA